MVASWAEILFYLIPTCNLTTQPGKLSRAPCVPRDHPGWCWPSSPVPPSLSHAPFQRTISWKEARLRSKVLVWTHVSSLLLHIWVTWVTCLISLGLGCLFWNKLLRTSIYTQNRVGSCVKSYVGVCRVQSRCSWNALLSDWPLRD